MQARWFRRLGLAGIVFLALIASAAAASPTGYAAWRTSKPVRVARVKPPPVAANMTILPANVMIREADGTPEDLSLSIAPTEARHVPGQRREWVVTATNNRTDELVPVLAEALYTAADGTLVTRAVSATLIIASDLQAIQFRLHIPERCVYVPGEFHVNGERAPDPSILNGVLVYTANLAAGQTLTLAYTTELTAGPPPPPPAGG